MDIHNFKDLSNFMYDEYDKMFESLGIDKVPKSATKYIFKSLKQRMKLYRKPLFMKEKLELKVQNAIDTLAYKSALWRFFHQKLYQIVIFRLEKQKEEPKEEPLPPPTTLPAVIIQTRDVPQVSKIEENDFAPF